MMKYQIQLMDYTHYKKIGKPEDVEKYKEAFVNMHFVFDIVKHGMVQPISVRNMYELGNSKKAKKSG